MISLSLFLVSTKKRLLSLHLHATKHSNDVQTRTSLVFGGVKVGANRRLPTQRCDAKAQNKKVMQLKNGQDRCRGQAGYAKTSSREIDMCGKLETGLVAVIYLRRP